METRSRSARGHGTHVLALVVLALSEISAVAQAQSDGLVEVRITGVPPLHVPVRVAREGVDGIVAMADAAMRDTIAPDATPAARREWQERRAASIESLSTASRALGTPDARRIGLMATGFVTEDTVARSVDALVRHQTAMQTTMTTCGGLAFPELQPWIDRCRELARYWEAMAVWRRGPLWPPECEPQRSILRPAAPSGPVTLAVVLSETSLRSASEGHRLRAAVIAAARAWMPGIGVLGVDELEAIESAHAQEQRSDGTSCLSGDLASALEVAHPRLWLAHVAASCPRHGHTSTCRLDVSFWSSTADPDLPPDRAVDLGTPTAGVDDFARAIAQLTESAPSAWPRTGRFGVSPWTPPSGAIEGSSTSIDAADIARVLAPTPGALMQCRDLDASPPRPFHAGLEISPRGRVVNVTLTEGARGVRRRACLERVFDGLRFPASPGSSRTVVVSGSFGLTTDPQVSIRVSSPPSLPITSDARTLDALVACRPAGDVQTATLHVELAANGAIHATPADATSSLGDCAARALSLAVSVCGAPQRADVVVCIGAPATPTRPTRP